MVAKAKVVAKVAKVAKESTNVKKGRVAKTVVTNVAKTVVAKVAKSAVPAPTSTETAAFSIEALLSRCIDVMSGVKKKKKVKIGTFSEVDFECPSVNCEVVLPRYRAMFLHFESVCKPEGWKDFRWWCDVCEIPRFWLFGTDLVRHKQEVHGINDFPKMLSYCIKPDGFQDSELLEFNMKDFGLLWQKRNWQMEVNEFAKTGEYCRYFAKPVSSRKRKVSAAGGAASDIVKDVGGDIVADGPMDLSSSGIAGGSPANNAMSEQVDAAVSSENYNTIDMLRIQVDEQQAEILAEKRLLVKRDSRIAELEGKLAASEELGRVKFNKLLQYSKQQLGSISVDSNYWRDKFMKKFAEDWEQMVSYGAIWT